MALTIDDVCFRVDDRDKVEQLSPIILDQRHRYGLVRTAEVSQVKPYYNTFERVDDNVCRSGLWSESSGLLRQNQTFIWSGWARSSVFATV